MKKTFLLFAFSIGLVVSSLARTWTSSDGTKTFEGELISYDAGQGKVTVRLSNGRTMEFEDVKLSEADRDFLKKYASESGNTAESVQEALEAQVVGKKVAKAKLSKLDGNRFRKSEVETVPEYYFLMYSASWCPPCRAAAPGLVKSYHDELADNKKVLMIHVSADRDDKTLKNGQKKKRCLGSRSCLVMSSAAD